MGAYWGKDHILHALFFYLSPTGCVSETRTLTRVAMPTTIKQFSLQDSVLLSMFLSLIAVHHLLTLEYMN